MTCTMLDLGGCGVVRNQVAEARFRHIASLYVLPVRYPGSVNDVKQAGFRRLWRGKEPGG
jgi:hypothetical protein